MIHPLETILPSDFFGATESKPLPKGKVRVSTTVPIRSGSTPVVTGFNGLVDGKEHIAIAFNEPKKGHIPLVRIHSECLTGDVLRSDRCDCGAQLSEAIEIMSRESGLILYLRQEGRGIGLLAKLEAYCLQDQGFDTYEANEKLGHPHDSRDYAVAAQMLFALGHSRIRLLTNNPKKVDGLTSHGIIVERVINTAVYQVPENSSYLEAKRLKGGHKLGEPK